MYRSQCLLVILSLFAAHLILAKIAVKINYVENNQLNSDIYFLVPSTKANVSIHLQKPLPNITKELYTNWLYTIHFESWEFWCSYSLYKSSNLNPWCDLIESVEKTFYGIERNRVTCSISFNNHNRNVTMKNAPLSIYIQQDSYISQQENGEDCKVNANDTIIIKTKLFNNPFRDAWIRAPNEFFSIVTLDKDSLNGIHLVHDLIISKFPIFYICGANRLPPFDVTVNSCLENDHGFNYSRPPLDPYIAYSDEKPFFLYNFQEPVKNVTFIVNQRIEEAAIIEISHNNWQPATDRHVPPIVGAKIKNKMIFFISLQKQKNFEAINDAIGKFMHNDFWQVVGERPYSHCGLLNFIKRYLVKSKGDFVVYCDTTTTTTKNQKRSKRDPNANFIFSTDDLIVAARSNIGTVRITRPTWDDINPVVEYGEELRGANIYLPTYILADIRRSHIGRPRPPNLPRYIREYLDNNMQFQSAAQYPNNPDQQGHLLATSLGGSNTETYNFIPMTRLVNTGTGSSETTQRSAWRAIERRIYSFFTERDDTGQQPNINGRISWRTFVMYDQGSTLPNRPIGFSVRFAEYANANDQEPAFQSDDITFSNSNSDNICEFAMNPHMSQMC